MIANLENRFRNLQEQFGDPILTALTIILLLLMFVVAPLQAVGIVIFEALGFVLALVMIVGALFMSGSKTAFIAMLAAFGMNVTAASLRVGRPRAARPRLPRAP